MSDRQLAASFDQTGDAPVVVLGNSLGTTGDVWARQLPELRNSFRLLRYDLPGHGGSAAWPGPYSIDELGAAVLSLLDARAIERAAYCGISLGGMIGMWLAASAAERIWALGLVCTSAYLPPADGWRYRASLVRTAGMASVSAQVVGRWFTTDYAASAPEVVSDFRSTLEQVDPTGYAGCCEAIAAMDLRGSLAAVTAPALVIAGAADRATPPDHGADIAARIVGARLEIAAGTAHLATVSSPDLVTPALAAHLRATAAGSGVSAGRH
ncbi:MAG: 3-oxoadipate enol-lactonase [Streptosporangiaceae bacterium]